MIMYSPSVREADRLIAVFTETEIEAEAWRLRNARGDFDQALYGEYAYALSLIDRLTVTGALEDHKANTLQRMEDNASQHLAMPGPLQITPKLQRALDGLDSLFEGLKSKDPDTKSRFEAFFKSASLGEKSFQEAAPLLSVIEAPKRRGGRPTPIPPWRDFQDDLAFMRNSIAGGCTVRAAAIAAAQRERSETRVSGTAEHGAHYLQKQWRLKMSIRERTV